VGALSNFEPTKAPPCWRISGSPYRTGWVRGKGAALRKTDSANPAWHERTDPAAPNAFGNGVSDHS